MRARRHAYESQASSQTLAEGLAEYFAAHPDLKRDADLSTEAARRFFRSHDVVHVVYGCDTSLPDEAIVKLSSLFGTTGGFGVLRGYALHESMDIYRRLSFLEALRTLALAPWLITRTLWRCMRQRSRWPWDDHAALMGVPLVTLRERFGIRVAHVDRHLR